MPAYVIADIDVTDPEEYVEYRKLSSASAAKYGGRFIVRGGAVETLEGDWQPGRLVVLEFSSLEQAHQWYNSPEYRAAMEIRHRTARSRLILVEGA